jgi:hypothetical protein
MQLDLWIERFARHPNGMRPDGDDAVGVGWGRIQRTTTGEAPPLSSCGGRSSLASTPRSAGWWPRGDASAQAMLQENSHLPRSFVAGLRGVRCPPEASLDTIYSPHLSSGNQVRSCYLIKHTLKCLCSWFSPSLSYFLKLHQLHYYLFCWRWTKTTRIWFA